MEFHPRTDLNHPQLAETRIILGSFPTYPYTFKSTEEKAARSGDHETGFFYGSERNRFWHWYKEFVDPSSEKTSVPLLMESLKAHGIAITDVVYSCVRKGQSASDNDLSQRVYNHAFFRKPGKGEVLKILCTSKGVMNEMLLTEKFFALHPDLSIDEKASQEKEKALMDALGGSLTGKPVIRVVAVENGGMIECTALPSPGSPFRSLKAFGFVSGNAGDYLRGYLRLTFEWFLSR